MSELVETEVWGFEFPAQVAEFDYDFCLGCNEPIIKGEWIKFFVPDNMLPQEVWHDICYEDAG